MNNSLVGAFFRNFWVRLVLIFDALLLVIIVTIAIINSFKSSVLTLNVAPVNATISVNGKTYTNGSYSLNPGEYEVKITHESLTPKTLTVNLESGHNLSVAAFLKSGESADPDLSFYLQKDNYTSFLKLAEIASASNNLTFDRDSSAEAFISETQQKLNFVENTLPLTYAEYAKGNVSEQYLTKEVSIIKSSSKSCKTFLCLKVNLNMTKDTTLARNLLKEHGANLNDYEVIYEMH